MFSSEGLTAEESIFTLIQVAARTCFLWPEDSRPCFLLAAGWRPPSGCTATCSSLRLPTMFCHVGCSNLAIYFIKPLCSARWWNLIQFNTITGVSLKETVHYLSHILWIETNHKSHFYTSGWDYTKMCVYRVCLHLFYVWLMTAFESHSFLFPFCLISGQADKKACILSHLTLAGSSNHTSLWPCTVTLTPLHPLNTVKTSSHFRPSWEPPWPPL